MKQYVIVIQKELLVEVENDEQLNKIIDEETINGDCEIIDVFEV